MRHLLFLATILLIASGCIKDDGKSGFPVTDGDRLVSYSFVFNSEEYEAAEFIYNKDNRIIKSFNKLARGSNPYENYYEYDENDRLTEVFNSDIKETYQYDESGNLIKILFFVSRDYGSTFVKRDRAGFKLHYDYFGKISRKEILYNDGREENFWGYAIKNFIYQWEDGNIVKAKGYNRDSVRAITYLYEYDNKPNYRFKQPATHYFNAKSLSKNNVVEEVLLDHLGYYPSVNCRVCNKKYYYNKNGMPVFQRNSGSTESYVMLKYE
ncbi:MAG: hypothetical protein EA411_06965 [Saprospirales bacterium]|nr:MAG: hypothetical protein EA411_06965 [Saprospirales bacterium]